MSNDHAADLLGAIRALPRQDRLRLVEQLKQELTEEAEAVSEGRSIIGLFSDEAELLDDVSRDAMAAREHDPLRVDGA